MLCSLPLAECLEPESLRICAKPPGRYEKCLRLQDLCVTVASACHQLAAKVEVLLPGREPAQILNDQNVSSESHLPKKLHQVPYGEMWSDGLEMPLAPSALII